MFDIKGYESMSKLSLKESERSMISNYADILIESFDELEKINLEELEPLITVLNVNSALREDIAIKLSTKEELLSNAPEQADGYFQVPKTID